LKFVSNNVLYHNVSSGLNEFMINQPDHRQSIFWIFVQTFQNKILALAAHRYISRKIYLFINNTNQILFFSYLERNSTIEKLIC